jgi:hypothetical protein
MKDLTVSAIDRQNILNNNSALENIQAYIGLSGMYFQGEYRFTRQQIADFYSIDNSTIERYLSQNEEELKHNGYVNLKGKALKEFKGLLWGQKIVVFTDHKYLMQQALGLTSDRVYL